MPIMQPPPSTTVVPTAPQDLLQCLEDQRRLVAELRHKYPSGHPQLTQMEMRLKQFEDTLTASIATNNNRQTFPATVPGAGEPQFTWRGIDRPPPLPPSSASSWRVGDPGQMMVSSVGSSSAAAPPFVLPPPSMPIGAPLPPIPPPSQQQQQPYDPVQAMETFLAFQQIQQSQQLQQHQPPFQSMPVLPAAPAVRLLGPIRPINTGGTHLVRVRSPQRREDGRPSRFESMSRVERERRGLSSRYGSTEDLPTPFLNYLAGISDETITTHATATPQSLIGRGTATVLCHWRINSE